MGGIHCVTCTATCMFKEKKCEIQEENEWREGDIVEGKGSIRLPLLLSIRNATNIYPNQVVLRIGKHYPHTSSVSEIRTYVLYMAKGLLM